MLKTDAITKNKRNSATKTETQNPNNNTMNSNINALNASYNYLLIKNLPMDINEETIRDFFKDYQTIEEVIIVKNSNNIYLKFGEMAEIKQILEKSEIQPYEYEGQRLKMCFVNKLPLDLNEKSRIVLVTLYYEKIEVNVHSVYDIFKEFGAIRKIIIFKKKNYQVFIEFESSEDAFFFKQALHNINYKGFFFLKIQFTKKNELIVNANNIYEYDFSKPDLTLNGSTTFPQNSQSNPAVNVNIITSLKNLELNNNFNAEINKISKNNESMSSIHEKHNEGQYNIKISNLNPDVKHRAIFNLFSLYGNIEKISLHKANNTAIVTYENDFSQPTACFYLNDVNFFDRKINVQLAKENDIEPKYSKSFILDPQMQSPVSPIITRNLNEENIIYYNNPKYKIDFNSKTKSIQKPNKILYLYNISPVIDIESIKDMFETFEAVISMNYLNETKNCAIAIFDSVESAIKILCIFRNINIGDKLLRINFANDSLIKQNALMKEQATIKYSTFSNLDRTKERFTPNENMKRNNLKGVSYTPQSNFLKSYDNFHL